MYKQRGYVPENVYISSWFSFLLKHGVRPYQSFLWDERVRGMNLVSNKSGFRFQGKSGPVYWGEDSTEKFYFDGTSRIFSDKIAKFAVRCNELSNGATFRRLRKLVDVVYIDEVQDFAGYDLEILRLMMMEGIEVIAVGDPRQCTYQTHIDQKYKKYSGPAISEFFRTECRRLSVSVDETTLNATFRNCRHIVEVSAALYPELPIPESLNRYQGAFQGVQFVSEADFLRFLRITGAVQLRYSVSDKRVSKEFPVLNMGKSKGMEFDSILLFPTGDMQKWLLGEAVVLKDKTKAQLYVALTRARNTAAIVLPDKIFRRLRGIQQTSGLSHCKVDRLEAGAG